MVATQPRPKAKPKAKPKVSDYITAANLTIHGTIEQVDLEKLTCQLVLPNGKVPPSLISCVFPAALSDWVDVSLDREVVVNGEAEFEGDASGGLRITRLNLSKVDPGFDLINPQELVATMEELGMVGMWKDRTDMEGSVEFVRRMRDDETKRRLGI